MPSTPVDAWAQRSHRLAAWLSHIALGDRQAFAALYRETSAHLFGVVLRICWVPYDHWPIRSWPLYRARQVMREVLSNPEQRSTT